jgi:hypothetical protein
MEITIVPPPETAVRGKCIKNVFFAVTGSANDHCWFYCSGYCSYVLVLSLVTARDKSKVQMKYLTIQLVGNAESHVASSWEPKNSLS